MEGDTFQSLFGGPVTETLLRGFEYLILFAPIWLPIFIGALFGRTWLAYVRAHYISLQDPVLLEIRLPNEIAKSPAAMETVLASLNIKPGESTFIARLWNGGVRPWWSLEFASIEGTIHIYIWTWSRFRRQVERLLYAQFPNIEVIEAADYTTAFRFDLDEIEIRGCDFRLGQPDPFPLTTYKDYELSGGSGQAAEGVMDPLANVFEILGSMGPGEQFWIQILFKMHSDMRKPGALFETWKLETWGQQLINGIKSNPSEIELRDTPDGPQQIRRLSEEQKLAVKSILGKIYTTHHFDCGVRAAYVATKDRFDGTNIPALTNLWRPFSRAGDNQLSVNPTRWFPKYDYPWQDYRNKRQNRDYWRFYDAYRLRSWFHEPYKYRPYVLSATELATIFHFPGSYVQTPGMPRIPSTRQGAPSNLPV
jgi:hypothetical protein